MALASGLGPMVASAEIPAMEAMAAVVAAMAGVDVVTAAEEAVTDAPRPERREGYPRDIISN
jgi:hypothetical protein